MFFVYILNSFRSRGFFGWLLSTMTKQPPGFRTLRISFKVVVGIRIFIREVAERKSNSNGIEIVIRERDICSIPMDEFYSFLTFFDRLCFRLQASARCNQGR